MFSARQLLETLSEAVPMDYEVLPNLYELLRLVDACSMEERQCIS